MITIQNTSINSSLFLWAKNKIWYQIAVDAAWASFESYYVEISITLNGRTFRQQQNVSSVSIHFDVQDAVSSLIEASLLNSSDLPTTPFITGIYNTNYPYNATVVFTEYINGVAGATINSSFKAINAGLDNEDFTYPKQNEWIFEDFKFMTSTAKQKPTCTDTPEFLSHYNTYSSVTNIDINVRLFYEDGTSNDYVAYANHASSQKFYTIATGYQALNIAANLLPSKVLRTYAVWVSKTGIKTYRLSEVFTYEMFPQPELEKKTFIFQNSLGFYETVFFTGNIQKQISSKKTVLKKLYGSGVIGYQLAYDNDFVNEQTGKRIITLATSWLSNDFADALQDFAISKKVWLIDTRPQQDLIPVVIENISAVYYEKNNELIGYVITASYAYDIDIYTKDIARNPYDLPLAPPEPLPAAGWKLSPQLNFFASTNSGVGGDFTYNKLTNTFSLFFKNEITFDSSFDWNNPNFIFRCFPPSTIWVFNGTSNVIINLPTPIITGQMNHLLITRNNGTELVYWNNVLINTRVQSTAGGDGRRFNIGRFNNTGQMFDFKFYERVVDASERTAIFTSGGATSPGGAFIDIPFTENAGRFAADISGNNRTLYLANVSVNPTYYSLGVNNHHIDIDSNPILV